MSLIVLAWIIPGLLFVLTVIWSDSKYQDITLRDILGAAIIGMVLGPFSFILFLCIIVYDWYIDNRNRVIFSKRGGKNGG